MTVAKIYIFVLSFFFFKETTHAYVIMCQSVIETYRKKISNHTSKFDKSTKYVYLIPFDIKDRCFCLIQILLELFRRSRLLLFSLISTFTSPTCSIFVNIAHLISPPRKTPIVLTTITTSRSGSAYYAPLKATTTT